jgi:hypothetical protein
MAYYLKALGIIARHPIAIARHPRAGFVIGQVARRKFRLHWLRDAAREQRTARASGVELPLWMFVMVLGMLVTLTPFACIGVMTLVKLSYGMPIHW